jgi:hypothetical protein
MRNPHGASTGLGGPLDSRNGGSGGSVRQRPPAMRVPPRFWHLSPSKQSCARTWLISRVERGLVRVVLGCRGEAMAEWRRGHAGVGVLSSKTAYSLPNLAQKKRGGAVVLTESSNRLARYTETSMASSGGGHGRRFEGGVDAAILRASGFRDSSRGAPVKVLRGSRRAKGHRRRNKRAAELLTGVGSW